MNLGYEFFILKSETTIKTLIINIIAIIVLCINVDFNIKTNGNKLLWENIEALAQDEGDKNHCPDPYDVPHRFPKVERIQQATYQSNSSGQISIGGVLYGGYSKNTSVIISIKIVNCSGEQKGACCKHESIGTFPI